MTNATIKHDCKAELNQAELRATPTRLAVMELLERTDKPVDIITVKEYLNQRAMETDPATIFRIMNSFTQKGITKQISFNEGKFRYELANQNDHHHLICESCGKVEDISDCAISELQSDIQQKKGFSVKSHALEFYGLCENCQK